MQKVKSVCIMTSVHHHDDVRIYHKEATALKLAGFDVKILCSDFCGVDENGIEFIKINVPKGRLSRIMFSSGRFFKAAKALNCDCYHFHDPELINAGKKLSKFAKVIYDVHEDVPRQILNKPYLTPFIAKISSKYFEKSEQKAVKKFYAVVTATPFITNRLKLYNDNTITVCNYPKLEEFEEISTDYQAKENCICYVGGITKIRGIFEMITAMETVNAKLILAGEFETAQLKEQAISMKGYEKVDYRGFVGRSAIKAILTSSKAGLVILQDTLAYRDSIPVKMFEYMAAGVPVIASNFPYWQQIVDDSKCGVCVNPSNKEEVANAINYILNNSDVAIEMGKSGKSAVLQKYNWNVEKKKLISLYFWD